MNTRLRNWHVRKSGSVYIVCGEKYDNDKFVYEHFGLLEITKVVSAGFQCRILDISGIEKIYSCRWDMADKSFNYKPDLLEKFRGYSADVAAIAEYLGNAKLVAVYEDKNEPQSFVELD